MSYIQLCLIKPQNFLPNSKFFVFLYLFCSVLATAEKITMDKKVIALLSLYQLYVKKKNKRKKRAWHKPWLGDYNRLSNSFVFALEPMIRQDDQDFIRYIRIDQSVYEELLLLVSDGLTKTDTNTRLAISPREKLSLTLSYLAEGKIFMNI